ncbi:hypothetical protein B0T17DRAFT_599977 [Bombardia bombarda]|uniref:Helicase C-terminal domain-containing protein n=1 Tax=Bombardia bombarda TaxID=252184 RepID=A0AA39X1D5_9PEZI|nr:hypothetical protein B0T17DRAFT_599977 [Bombardia bombarda]
MSLAMRFKPDTRPRLWDLSTYYVNVLRTDTNKRIRFRMVDLIEDDKVTDEVFDDYEPELYRWSVFEQFLKEQLNYDPDTYEITWSQWGSRGPVANGVQEPGKWEEILDDIITDNRKKIRALFTFSDLCFVVHPKDKTLPWATPITVLDSEPKDIEPEVVEPVKETKATPAPSSSKPSKAPLSRPPLSKTPVSKTPVSKPPLSKSTGTTAEGSKKKPTPTVRRSDVEALKKAGLAPKVEPKVELVDVNLGEVKTQDEEDNDYGAIDDGIVDTYVGSFNNGDNPEMWRDCLEFFKIPTLEYAQKMNNKKKGQARVPVKTIPGMSVGLFDYQLMGIFNLLKVLFNDVSGGLLSDEQGLGKTQEMCGLIALANQLRRSKAEAKAKAKDAVNNGKHNAPNSGAKTCPMDGRYGIKCYCYHTSTRQLADLLPKGFSVIVTPARGVEQIFRECSSKLDTTVMKLRILGSTKEKEKLTDADIKALKSGQSDYIVICPSDKVSQLQGKGNKLELIPGAVFLDEFHEYTAPKGTEDSATIAWLKALKARDPKKPPLVYFVSGTPLDTSPADIRQAIALFERDSWKDESHTMSRATLAAFDELTATYHTLVAQQSNGEDVPKEAIAKYRQHLNSILRNLMVRRLGTEEFAGISLTSIGPLKVNIVDHQLPDSLVADLQALADSTKQLAEGQVAAGAAPSVSRFLRSNKAQDILLRLRLASTFPSIASPSSSSSDNFTFTREEIVTELSTASNTLSKTRYYPHIPHWAAASPKLATIDRTIETMLIPDKGHPLSFWKRIKPAWVHSGMTQIERRAALDKFLEVGQAPPNVLVTTVELAGTGLNLQKAGYMVITSPAWTKRDSQQAYYRIHRVGQRQKTVLQLLTGRWNPAERAVLARYEAKGVEGAMCGRWEMGLRRRRRRVGRGWWRGIMRR